MSDNALRFAAKFDWDSILNRLHEHYFELIELNRKKVFINATPKTFYFKSFTKKFYFSSMYESYYLAKEQFKKFGIEYTEKMYEDWRTSQNKIFNSWNLIKSNIDNPEYLTQFYQRGIAMALNGLKNNLKEQECWDQLSKKLQ